MNRSHTIPTTLPLAVLASVTMCCAVLAAAAPLKLSNMPISRNWRPGGVIGKGEARTAVAAKPRVLPKGNKIDLNTCSLEQLQNLPGVGAAMGAHIMAGRPYRNFDDLARDGVPLNTIEQIRPLVTVGP
jgi:DNA uptake protein ComE-like DNA-binding protein